MSNSERHEEIMLKRNFALLADWLSSMVRIAGGTLEGLTFLPFYLHRPIYRILRPAEAMVRRLLVIMAVRLGPTLAPAPAQRSRGSRARDVPRAPAGFSMTEPWPSTTPYHLRRTICGPRPRIRTMNETTSPPDAPEKLDGARLLARLKGLALLLDDPDRYAHRMARWFARRRPGLRNSPLKLGRPPVPRNNPYSSKVSDVQLFAQWAMDRWNAV